MLASKMETCEINIMPITVFIIIIINIMSLK